jgi:DNA-binding LacI/PurR family transcriptional regulator
MFWALLSNRFDSDSDEGIDMSERVTLADVARLAGVSKTSASMALADSARVATHTKDSVRKAAAELGYVPHFAASSLRSQRADTIAVVLPHVAQHVFSHPVFIDLLEGISTVANELDLSVVLSTARSAQDESSAYSRIIRGRQAAGVIVAAASVHDTNPDEINRAGYPVVVVGRVPRSSDVASVGIDDLGGARAATKHLVEVHGASRIGHVSGPLDHQSSIDKRDAYVAALAEAGLTIDPRLSFEGNYEEFSGRSAAIALLPNLRPGDAVFFANDQMAIGAIEEWRKADLRVPRDIRVVSYDNHPMSRHATPALTTVGADMVQVGESALRQLMRLIQGETNLAPIEFPTELIVRESCGCAPPGAHA